MKILQLSADPGVCIKGTKGASVHLRSMARAFKELGHEVRTISACDGRERRPSVEDLLRVIEESGAPDAIYERYSLGFTAGLETARLIGSLHCLEINAPLFSEATAHRPNTVQPYDRNTEFSLFQQTDLAVAVSRSLAEYVGTKRKGPTMVVPNGCDPDLFDRPATLQGAKIAFLGHPKPWHGATVLPQVVRELALRGHGDVSLLLVGGGEGADQVMRAAELHGVADRLRVTGAVSQVEVPSLLQECALAVAPYPETHFFYFSPIKIVECMAAGLPVVASSLGDIPETLSGTGVLVSPGDVGELVRASSSLLSSTDLRAGLGKRARRRALRHYTWTSAAKRILQAVEEVRCAA